LIRLTIEQLRPGQELARAIMNPGRPQDDLLKAGYAFTGRSIAALKRFPVDGVWVVEDTLGFIDEMMPPEVEEARRAAIAQVKASFEAVERHPGRELDLRSFERVAGGLLDAVAAARPQLCGVESCASHENFLYVHSANACLLTIALGRALKDYLLSQRKRPEANFAPELKELAVGALLHDIGNVRLSPDLRYRPDDLTAAELEKVREHTRHGYDMIRHVGSPLLAQMALNHHQRWDGKGYPVRRDHKTHKARPPLAGESIPVFCRFLAVTDVFDTAIGEQFFSEPKSPVQTFHEMRFSMNQGWFDPVAEEGFYRIVPAFGPGTTVTLSTGELAAVTDFNTRSPCRPPVLLLVDAEGAVIDPASRDEIDLSTTDEVSIVGWQGRDVSEFIF